MSRQYSAKTFFRNTPYELLKQYFKGKNIDLGFDLLRLHETEVNPLFVALEALPAATRASIDGDFRVVNDLACEAGIQALLGKVAPPDDDWPARFEKMSNNYERALWAFMNDPARFRLVGCFHEMDRRAGWRRRFVGIHLDPVVDEESLQTFIKHLCLFYRRQGRGRFCHVDYYLRREPERHCYFAYPEDYASTEIGYDEHGRFQQRARQKAFELIFVYRPIEGMLEILCRGGNRQIEELQRIFCEHVIGLERLPEDGRAPYDLRVLKDPTFSFPTDPDDRVADVEIRQLRLDMPDSPHESVRRRITLSASSNGPAGDTVRQLMNQALDRHRVPLEKLHVSEAKLRFTFRPVNGDRPKTLTFDVRYPDRCTLKDEAYDNVARKCLRRWRIAHN